MAQSFSLSLGRVPLIFQRASDFDSYTAGG